MSAATVMLKVPVASNLPGVTQSTQTSKVDLRLLLPETATVASGSGLAILEMSNRETSTGGAQQTQCTQTGKTGLPPASSPDTATVASGYRSGLAVLEMTTRGTSTDNSQHMEGTPTMSVAPPDTVTVASGSGVAILETNTRGTSTVLEQLTQSTQTTEKVRRAASPSTASVASGNGLAVVQTKTRSTSPDPRQLQHARNYKLHLMVYSTPGLPFGVYQTIQRYLEAELDCQSFLSIESRWNGPPKDKVDPFTSNDVDIGFMGVMDFLRLSSTTDKFVELLPVAAVPMDARCKQLPVVYSDVIIRKNDVPKFQDLVHLKDQVWVCSDKSSMTGFVAVLLELKKRGLNENFFRRVDLTGSETDSIARVLSGSADAAAIDGATLDVWSNQNAQLRDELDVLCTLGPLPAAPIAVNARLPGPLKDLVCSSLLAMASKPNWSDELKKQGVWGFNSIVSNHFNDRKDLMEVLDLSNHNPVPLALP